MPRGLLALDILDGELGLEVTQSESTESLVEQANSLVLLLDLALQVLYVLSHLLHQFNVVLPLQVQLG